MLIGELSRRTGASERLLRYYERMELIHPERRANGYRDYDDRTVQTVRRIRALLAVGLPTRLIRQILPCSVGEATLSGSLPNMIAARGSDPPARPDRCPATSRNLDVVPSGGGECVGASDREAAVDTAGTGAHRIVPVLSEPDGAGEYATAPFWVRSRPGHPRKRPAGRRSVSAAEPRYLGVPEKPVEQGECGVTATTTCGCGCAGFRPFAVGGVGSQLSSAAIRRR
ncbi:MerR family transcriptional regulator [Streptomyces seoulensis]|uniref:MerR family transcriptional regulator n=1 Tax=Streptomyces seoulensis TaxID=73044 RepID=A0A4P6TPK8_STRSO|nr:MerR family transcriptional regulator [Streptomyces seoulensis]